MSLGVSRSQVALAVAAAFSAGVIGIAADTAIADKVQGKYVAGDFHNHTTCSDGSTSMQKLVSKSMNKDDAPWGLDWFVQAGHGGSGVRNCTLTEDPSLGTPAYPHVPGQGPTTTWANSIGAANVKGNAANGTPLNTQANPAMWRWQSVQEFQYPLLEYLAALKNQPLFMGLESVVAGHEHSSMSVITGQLPASLDSAPLPTFAGYSPLGNATALSLWSYCFDRGDADTSRGGGQGWECSVTGSPNSTSAALGFNATAQKLIPAGGTGTGNRGHLKTVEAMKWMAQKHPNASYYVPAHLERAGPFNPNGNNGFNVEHLRNFNNAAPDVAFGMETQPGHGASDARGEYTIRRNNIGGVFVDTVGGTTYGGTGVYGAQIGGVWDALLGEGRNWWFFASSDWHNRGMFGPDDRRTSQDFYPGEYQRNYTMVRNGADPKLRPQTIVDGLRTGNTFVASGQLIDRLSFIACAARTGQAEAPANFAVQERAVALARNNTDAELANCAFMGEKLVVEPGTDIIVSIVVRDPSGTNYSPYTFENPSLAQVGISQPLNAPVLDHIDVIRGLVSGYKTPGAADYAGQWPNDWISNPNMANVPPAAKNTTAGILRTFNSATWEAVSSDRQFKKMTFRIRAVNASQYVRLRGTNLPANLPFETDANGNPLTDLWTNSSDVNPSTPTANDRIPANESLRIVCRPVPSSNSQFDGCPSHLPTKNGSKYVALDVAAWADLWFYSNPIYIEVRGSTVVAGVK